MKKKNVGSHSIQQWKKVFMYKYIAHRKKTYKQNKKEREERKKQQNY